jgi:hypothetical protein
MRRLAAWTVPAALLALAGATGCQNGGSQDTGPTVIVSLPEDASADTLQVSTNKRDWACLAETEGGIAVRSSQPVLALPSSRITGLSVSAAGLLAFWAEDALRLYVGDKCEGIEGAGPGWLWWAPDGRHWAAAYATAHREFISTERRLWVVVDWETVGPFDTLTPPVWSPDSGHCAFFGLWANKITLYVDGRPFKEFGESPWSTMPQITEGAFLPLGVVFTDSGDVATIAPVKDGKGWEVARSGRTVAQYDGGVVNMGGMLLMGSPTAVAGSSLTASRDGRVLAWWAKAGAGDGTDRWTCFVDGRAMASSKGVAPWEDPIILSDNGKRFAFIECEYSGDDPRTREVAAVRVVVDGQVGPAYEEAVAFAFSPDGSACAYWARDLESKELVLVLNGREAAREAGRVGEVVFSPDGKHYAYAVERGARQSLVVDGLAQARYCDRIYHLSLDRDGAAGFVGLDGRNLVSVRLPPVVKPAVVPPQATGK